MNKNRWIPLVAAALAVATGAPRTAQACGGFFCSQSPIDQTGERVLFGVDGDQVEAHIQIFYQGEAMKFAWVLPMPTEPSSIGVGTDQLFTVLAQTTRPTFNTQFLNNGQCYFGGWGFGEDADGAFAGGGPPSPANEPGVEVLQQASVGPYDYAVIKGTTSDSGEAVFTWLAEHGYDQPEVSKPIIDSYVAENHVFVAVKLTNESDTGDIQPLVVKFKWPAGCVPLRLTSIAAQEDMDVWTWVLGQHRSVPVNFFHVEVNEAKIDWLGYGSNYKEVAKEAVDSAAGRAFVTEYAGDTNAMKGRLWKPGQYDTTQLLGIETPWAFLQAMLNQGYPRTPQMQNIIREHIPMPQALKDTGVTEQQFYNNMQNYQQWISDLEFDAAALVADIEAKIFKPLEEANGLFDKYRYMTRMYTIISPSEMIRDPIFMFNPDLPNVSNVHNATAKPYCHDDKPYEPYKVVVTLADGSQLVYEGDFNFGGGPKPTLTGDGALGGAAARVDRMYTSGPPAPVAPAEVAAVDMEFDFVTVGLLVDGKPNGSPDPGLNPSTSTCAGSANGGTKTAGCSTSPGRTAPFGGMLLLLALSLGAVVRRRGARASRPA